MERRNGGDPLAPPRPPKSLPIVHRLRASETPMMNAPLIHNNNNNNNNLNTNQINNTTATAQQQRNILLQQRHLQRQQLQLNNQQVITTAPLVPLQPITTFSRRRQPPHPIAVSPIPSLSSNIHNSETPVSPVTLAAPRPDNERLVNEYVDTPFRLPHPASRIQASSPANTLLHASTTTTSTTSAVPSHGSPKQFVPHNLSSSLSHANNTTAATTTTSSFRAARPTVLPLSSAVTKQPLSSFSKDISPALPDDADLHPSNGDSLNSITCPQCKRCRCEECQRPRQLPSRWVCDDTCLCSAESAIDYVSCLCVVKALYYHCSKDHEMDRETNSISCADDPCSCNPHNRTSRWGCLAALSICLPCLWCYWPMRGCVALCANCYARHSRHGCRCQTNKTQTQNNQTLSSTTAATIQNSGLHRTINHHHHHHHHNNHHRTNELTPEKRLLSSSPEF